MQNYQNLLETGYRLVQLEQHGEALQAFRKAAELRPEEKEPLVQLALLFQLLGDPEGAIGLLLKASDLDPQNAYILLNLGLIHYDEQSWDEAVRYLEAAVLVIDRGTAETRRQLAEEPHEKRAAILFQCDELDQTAAEAREMIAEIARQDAASHRELDALG